MKRDSWITCRQCSSADLQSWGRIPKASEFAGQTLDPQWDGGVLYLCRKCQLVFRHPVREASEYEALYGSAPGDIWESGIAREDHKRVRSIVAGYRKEASVLDVGCYDGALLASLGPGYRKFGVEASTAARHAAAQRGVEIVARHIRDLEDSKLRFDVVCAVDVIEHVIDPRAFVATLGACVNPGGLLVISTGTTDAPPWRDAGGSYWYCGAPEHISFICREWAAGIARPLGLELADCETFAYMDMDPEERDLARASFASAVSKSRTKLAMAGWLRGKPGSVAPRNSFGRPGLFDDHIVLTFAKAAA